MMDRRKWILGAGLFGILLISFQNCGEGISTGGTQISSSLSLTATPTPGGPPNPQPSPMPPPSPTPQTLAPAAAPGIAQLHKLSNPQFAVFIHPTYCPSGTSFASTLTKADILCLTTVSNVSTTVVTDVQLVLNGTACPAGYTDMGRIFPNDSFGPSGPILCAKSENSATAQSYLTLIRKTSEPFSGANRCQPGELMRFAAGGVARDYGLCLQSRNRGGLSASSIVGYTDAPEPFSNQPGVFVCPTPASDRGLISLCETVAVTANASQVIVDATTVIAPATCPVGFSQAGTRSLITHSGPSSFLCVKTAPINQASRALTRVYYAHDMTSSDYPVAGTVRIPCAPGDTDIGTAAVHNGAPAGSRPVAICARY